ncbi:MAG: LysM peptidoglycan-binding domain-containing protein [Oscillospiraceae bacterium]
MQIHVVQPGQTLWSIGREYGVLPGLLARFNGLTEPYRLAVGQAVLILSAGGALHSAAGGHGVFHCAEILAHAERALPAEPGVILAGAAVSRAGAGDEHRRPSNGKTTLLGYAYPWANERTLRGILPYADTLVPFTYGFTEAGELVEPEDEGLLALAKEFGAKTLLHLSTLTEQGSFSAQRAGAVLGDDAARGALIQNTVRVMREKGFAGVDVDFEYLGRALAASYAAFLRELREAVHAAGGYLYGSACAQNVRRSAGRTLRGTRLRRYRAGN